MWGKVARLAQSGPQNNNIRRCPRVCAIPSMPRQGMQAVTHISVEEQPYSTPVASPGGKLSTRPCGMATPQTRRRLQIHSIRIEYTSNTVIFSYQSAPQSPAISSLNIMDRHLEPSSDYISHHRKPNATNLPTQARKPAQQNVARCSY